MHQVRLLRLTGAHVAEAAAPAEEEKVKSFVFWCQICLLFCVLLAVLAMVGRSQGPVFGSP